MQARFYDPVAGRFLSIDPVAADIGNFNRYWYANNNPYKFVDPDGRNPLSPLDWYDFGKDVGSLVVNEIVYGAALVTGNAEVQNLALDALRDGALDAAASTAGLVSPKPGTGRDIKAAAKIGGAIVGSRADANKIKHIFNKQEHNLSAPSKSLGEDSNAYKAIVEATSGAVDLSKPGKFEVAVSIAGEKVTVRGAVVDGVAKIGTAFIKSGDVKP